MSDHASSQAATLRPASARYALYVLICLMTAYMLSFMDRLVLSLMIDPVRRDLDLSDTQVSLLVGFAFALFYAVLGLPIGRIADRSNRVVLITVGMVLWSAATVWCGAARNAVELFVARVTVGVGEAALTPASYSLIGDVVPRERLGMAMSIYSLGVLLGGGLAMAGGGFVVQWALTAPPVEIPLLGVFDGWRLAFLFAGLPGIALAALIALTIREPVRLITQGESPPTFAALFGHIRDNGRTFFTVLVGYSLIAIPAYAVVVWAPSHFIRAHGMQPAEIGVVFGLILGVGGAAAALLGGALSDRLSRRGMPDAPARLVLFSAIGHMPLLVAAFLVPDRTLALVLFGLGVFVMSIYGGLQHTTVQAITPARLRGQMAAVYMMAANIIGLGIGPTAIALLGDQVFGSIGPALAASCGVTAGLAILIIAAGLKSIRSTILASSAPAQSAD